MEDKALGEVFFDFLVCEGFTHCFFVPGGNSMNLLNSARTKFSLVPFLHEHSATIAAEYFSAVSSEGKKAFALVTAGPGLTNAMTAMAGAWLESRSVMVVGGQVKVEDLAHEGMRQLGIQEVDGVTLTKPISKLSSRITNQADLVSFFRDYKNMSGRAGPIFVEWCLDTQAEKWKDTLGASSAILESVSQTPALDLDDDSKHAIEEAVGLASRPIILVGSGLSRDFFRKHVEAFERLGIPLVFSWNAADYLDDGHPLNFGRPNTWGQLAANLIIQQCDLLISLGARLGLQQTGFAWDEFAPNAHIFQVDIDQGELSKRRQSRQTPILADASVTASFLTTLSDSTNFSPWLEYCDQIVISTPPASRINKSHVDFIQPQYLGESLCQLAPEDCLITPSSSGGAFTVAMQTLKLTGLQRLVSNKGLASMGYGLAGAIGLALSHPSKTVICLEGDGGFAQNLQEIGTVIAQNLRLKILLFDNDGYASIRTTQKSYFDGVSIGCDKSSGLNLPDWKLLCNSFGLRYVELNLSDWADQLRSELSSEGPGFIHCRVDPDQTYLPKIKSYKAANGRMKSNPLHLMEPTLPPEVWSKVSKYLPEGEKKHE